MFRLGQLSDVERGVAKRDKMLAVGKRDWFAELSGPARPTEDDAR
jgi:hypothetical protein